MIPWVPGPPVQLGLPAFLGLVVVNRRGKRTELIPQRILYLEQGVLDVATGA